MTVWVVTENGAVVGVRLGAEQAKTLARGANGGEPLEWQDDPLSGGLFARSSPNTYYEVTPWSVR